jgi:hypothetical protein
MRYTEILQAKLNEIPSNFSTEEIVYAHLVQVAAVIALDACRRGGNLEANINACIAVLRRICTRAVFLENQYQKDVS